MSLKDQLDGIERKLDVLVEKTIRNETDLYWLKGAVKITIPAILSIIGYLAIQYLGR